jgi:hypothetical protein
MSFFLVAEWERPRRGAAVIGRPLDYGGRIVARGVLFPVNLKDEKLKYFWKSGGFLNVGGRAFHERKAI